MGLINRIVPEEQLAAVTREYALEVAERGAFALASLKSAFNARHGGVCGLSRMAHDLLLRGYRNTSATTNSPLPSPNAASRTQPGSVIEARVNTMQKS